MKVYFFFKIYIILSVFELGVYEPIQLILHEPFRLNAIVLVHAAFVHISQSFRFRNVFSHIIREVI